MLSNFAIAKLTEKHTDLAERKKGRLHFLREAAFLGHAIAPLEIGNFYYLRQETDYDLVRAMVWWILSSDRNAPGVDAMIASVSPLLSLKLSNNQVSAKLADCDNKTYRDCLGRFLTCKQIPQHNQRRIGSINLGSDGDVCVVVSRCRIVRRRFMNRCPATSFMPFCDGNTIADYLSNRLPKF